MLEQARYFQAFQASIQAGEKIKLFFKPGKLALLLRLDNILQKSQIYGFFSEYISRVFQAFIDFLNFQASS